MDAILHLDDNLLGLDVALAKKREVVYQPPSTTRVVVQMYDLLMLETKLFRDKDPMRPYRMYWDGADPNHPIEIHSAIELFLSRLAINLIDTQPGSSPERPGLAVRFGGIG